MKELSKTQLPTLLNRDETCKVAGGISYRKLDRLMQEEGFPKPGKIGRICYWPRIEVAQWLHAVMEKREAA